MEGQGAAIFDRRSYPFTLSIAEGILPSVIRDTVCNRAAFRSPTLRCCGKRNGAPR